MQTQQEGPCRQEAVQEAGSDWKQRSGGLGSQMSRGPMVLCLRFRLHPLEGELTDPVTSIITCLEMPVQSDAQSPWAHMTWPSSLEKS